MTHLLKTSLLALLALLLAGPAQADPKAPGADPALYQKVVDKAVSFLKKSQMEDGSYSKQMGPAVTAIVTTGLLENGRPPQDPQVAKALRYLKGFVQKDGGIYTAGSRHRNYETAIAILCFQAANRDGSYDKLLADAQKFVKGLQWDKEEGHDVDSPAHGGAGYGSHRRPDLSNTQFFVEALHATGAEPKDDALQRALVFISRCQNLESNHNTTPFAAKINDGGFYYTPAAGGTSQAGTTANGGLRSYGSMTYAGLKSMIYAGVGPEDPRVQAAVEWIERNWTLQENPGMGTAGLYYYYHTMAKALDAMEVEYLHTQNGKQHDWRRELVQQLSQQQLPTGAWQNSNARWMEGEPNLVTGYALMALSHCRPRD